MHKLLLHPAVPGRLYQQNHGGVFRSDDYGNDWTTLHKGLPHEFGFGLALNHRDPETCYVVPLEPRGGTYRATSGALRIYQRKGKGWRAHGRGLPSRDAHLSILREGVASDTLKPCGVYVGTGGGHVFGSRDEGRSWKPIALYLPPVLSVSATVV